MRSKSDRDTEQITIVEESQLKKEKEELKRKVREGVAGGTPVI